MEARWFLSQFYEDTVIQSPVPVCSGYGMQWFCPTMPADLASGWALVQMLADSHQIAAAGQDPRIVVCPLLFDPSPLPEAVINAYTSWGATAGMSLAALLAKLHAAEPVFGITLTTSM